MSREQEAGGFRRVHRLTPLLRFWSLLVALGALFLANLNAGMIQAITAAFSGEHHTEAVRGTLYGLAALVALCVAVWFVSGLWWKNLGYRLGEEELELRRGVLSTQVRTARFDRTQAVDVVENVIPRLFGLAAVRVETAGGRGSVIEIGYLRAQDANALRIEILSRALGECNSSPERAEEPVVPEVPVGRAVLATLLRAETLFAFSFVVVLLALRMPVSTTLPVLVGLLPRVWNIVDTSWRFTARLAEEDQLEVAFGLADRRRQSIRLSRIHGVRINRPLLWRPFGWYEVQVSVAGYGASESKASGTTRILPVGNRAQAMGLMALVGAVSAEEAETYASPEGAGAPTYSSPRRARWVSPVDWKQQAVTLLERATIVHRGRFGRSVMVIANPHIQELSFKEGPVSQLLGLASVRLELVAGQVKMTGKNLERADATALLERLRQRRLPELNAAAG